MATGLFNLDALLAQPGFPAGVAAASPAPVRTVAAFSSVLDGCLIDEAAPEESADGPAPTAASPLCVLVFCPVAPQPAPTPATDATEQPAAGKVALSQSGAPESGAQEEKLTAGLPGFEPPASAEAAPAPQKERGEEQVETVEPAPEPPTALLAAPDPVTGPAAAPQNPPDPSVQGAADRGEAARSAPGDGLPGVAAEPVERTAGRAPEIAFAARLTDRTTAEAPAAMPATETVAAAPAPEAPVATPAFEAAQPAGAQPAARSVVTAPETEAPAQIEAPAPAPPRAEADGTPRSPALAWKPAAAELAATEPAATREPTRREAAGRAAEQPAAGPPASPEADAEAAPLSLQGESAPRRSSQPARESGASGPVRNTEAGTPPAADSVPAVKPVGAAKSAAPDRQDSPAVRPEPGAKLVPAQEVAARSTTPAAGATAATEQPRTSEEKPAAALEARPAAPVAAAAPRQPEASDAAAPAANKPPAPATAVDVPEPKSRPSDPVRDIALKVGGQEHKIEIRMAERAGEIRVSVHAPEGQLRRDLQEHLPELVRDLDRQGFAAETWRPAEPAARSDTAGSGTHEPPDRGAGQGNPQQDGRGRRNRPQPEWLEEMVRRIAAEPERNAWQQ